MIFQAQALSQQELIEYCRNAPVENHLGGSDDGNRVVRFDTNYAIKWGYGVFEQEYHNQLEAFTLVDPNIVRVPKPYAFFTDKSGLGYLVMEAVSGVRKENVEDEADIRALARILRHFSTIKATKPGPLALHGPSYALLFGESDHPTFEVTSELEEWFNHRLLSSEFSISLSDSEFTLCHLDFFPRNILWTANHPPCLLDWLTAGYWPRIFERCSHLILEDYISNPAILREPVSEEEVAQISLILQSWRNNQRYSL